MKQGTLMVQHLQPAQPRWLPILTAALGIWFALPLHGEQSAEPDSQELVLEQASDLALNDSASEGQTASTPYITSQDLRGAFINDIIVSGNRTTPTEAILSHIPYTRGERFDPNKTPTLIKNLYTKLKRFRNVSVYAEPLDRERLNLHIEVQEKLPVKDFVIKGNAHLSESEIRKKIDLTPTMLDPEEIQFIAQQIKKLYVEKGYNKVSAVPELTIDNDGLAIATITITEGKPSVVKRIVFKGNTRIPSKQLKQVLFTREDWLLSFLDKSGIYDSERLQGDKYMIEQYYQNNGYLQAKVTETKVDEDLGEGLLTLTFEVEEGERFKFGTVSAPGNDKLPEQILLSVVTFRPGDWYSREQLIQTMKNMEQLWGTLGYINATVEPSPQPDEETKIVNVTFFSDIGKQVRLNRLNIVGNRKTRDKVIRRRIMLQEGELITLPMLEMSKRNVESTGYFERKNGVDYRVQPIDEEYVDLEFIVDEAKTGNFNFQLTYGGPEARAGDFVSGIKAQVALSDTNWFGTGTAGKLEASWAKQEQTLVFSLRQPWLFDKPISAMMDIYHRRPVFDQLINITPRPIFAMQTGGNFGVGAIIRPNYWFLPDSQIAGTFGIESIRYQSQPRAALGNPIFQTQYQNILDRQFAPGDYCWLQVQVDQDQTNHPIHTSRGHRFNATAKVAMPTLTGNISFARLSTEVNWFTPLIDELNLVLHLRGFVGVVTQIGDRTVPFGELFHVGGEGTVRGFVWGQLEPTFANDPIGAKKSLFVNAELIFPLTPDFNIKGLVFYDGGTGWKNPYATPSPELRNNSFDYRHAVGIGIRLLSPMPISIDWGFKLDPRTNESSNELHFGSSYGW